MEELGYPLTSASRILDLGCGNGDTVSAFVDQGFDAYGCDFQYKHGPNAARLHDAGRIRLVPQAPYALPFDGDMFDLVISSQVFEHVQDYDATFAEIKRVLRPGGVSLNVFAPPYSITEQHVHVPFGTVFQSYAWILLWTKLGFRQAGQENFSAREAARNEVNYLKSSTNYLTTKQTIVHANRHFEEFRFCELEALRYHSSFKRFYPLVKHVPFIQTLLTNCVQRVLLVKKGQVATT